ncbi:hypothetical protein KGA66_26835 [Actinocrinis puniceicyclus]|uniref:Uncharacterized protein n=1 Tax=Actinocrinis puniceicyclus TaxID=977794 RepID=A0A8J8BDX0_9ACTN|nr:hypothetical protein [Actinocrinis puniceicyclus]MBS2966682.1 hypothetical protein [Actinocrinis puniceicyclus]
MNTGFGESISLAMHYESLTDALIEGRAIPAGRLFGLPDLEGDDIWVDIAGAAALVRVNPKAITGWLTRGGPKRKPFPTPYRLLYRLYWRKHDIDRWLQIRT